MQAYYLIYLAIAAAFAVLFTPAVKYFAFKYGFMDIPKPPRNLHAKPIPKLGGLAVYLSFVLVLIGYLYFGNIDFQILPLKFILALILGGLVLMIGGLIDDKYDLSAKWLWMFPAIASLIVVLSGIGVGIKFLTNPFGGTVSLDYLWFGMPLSGIVVFLWLMGMMFTSKFLDGIDGLVAGIGVISGFTMFGLCLTSTVDQPMIANIAIIFAGSLLGYLIYAWHPAKIFLGEGGSTFVGFVLGVLSVISGAKIATALLVMGIPILDVAWVILQRLIAGKSPFKGDRLHLHFRLLDLGLSQRQVVVILYSLSALFGVIAIFLQSMGKLVALGVLFASMISVLTLLYYLYKKKKKLVQN